MGHPSSKELTLKSSMYQWQESNNFVPLLKLHPHNYRHFQHLSKYYSTQYWIEGLSYFTTSLPEMVQNKMVKTSISIEKYNRPLHHRYWINTSNITIWKFSLWITQIYLYHIQNDQKLILQRCLILDI